MSLNVGSLVAYLDLDDTNFDRKTKYANKQIDGLILHLETLAKIKPDLDVKVTAKTAELDALKARLVELKAEAAKGADVRVDVAETMFKLAAVKAEIRALHAEAAKSLDLKTDPANAKLRELATSLDNVGGKLKNLKSPGGILAWGAVLGGAVIPAGNAAIGVLGGVTAAAVEAAGAVGVLALAFKGAGNATTAYQAYQTAMLKATNAKQRASAASTLNASAYGQASASTKAFARFDVNQLKPFGASLASSAQSGLLPGLQSGLSSMLKDAPQINGAITAIANSLGLLFTKAGQALDSPFWKQWIRFFGRDSANNIQMMGHTLGQFFEGLARMMERGSSGTHSLLGDLDAMATRFNHWSGSPAFLEWLAKVQADGHLVATVLAQTWAALKPILQGLGQAGRAELTLFGSTMSMIAHLPTGFLVVAGHYLPLIFIAAKVGERAMAGLGAASALAGKALLSLASVAPKTALVVAGAMDVALGPIGLAVAAATAFGLALSAFDGVTDPLKNAVSQQSLALTTAGSAAGDYADAIYRARNGLLALSKAKADYDAFQAYSTKASGDDMSAVQAAQKLGVPLALLENATTGGKRAKTTLSNYTTGIQRQINQNIQNIGAPAGPTHLNAAGQEIHEYTAAQSEAYRSALAMQKALDILTKSYGNQTAAITQQKEALRESNYQDIISKQSLDGFSKALGKQIVQHTNLIQTWGDALAVARKYHLSIDQIQALLRDEMVPATRATATQLHDAAGKASSFSWEAQSAMTPLGELITLLGKVKSPAPINVTADTSQAKASITDLLKLFGPGPSPIPGIPLLGSIPPSHGKSKKPAHNALGTNYFGGGYSWVGEMGAELIRMPRGTEVIPHGRSERMRAEASDAPVRLHPDTIRSLGAVIADQMGQAADSAALGAIAFYGGN